MKKKVLILSILVVAALLIALVVLFLSANDEQVNTSEKLSEGHLSVQVSIENNQYTYGDTVLFSSIIENISSEPNTYSFSTTCTQGTLYINSQPTQLGQGCGQAFTDIDLEPREKIKYEYVFELVRELSRELESDLIELDGELVLEPGTHEAYVEWQDVKSGTITFQVSE